MGNNIVETLIGAVVLVIAGLFLVFAYSTAGVAPKDGYTLVAKFNRVDGLTVGSDVRMSGIKIGTVTSQELDRETFDAVVQFTVADGVEVPADTAVKISSDGLLGDTYLSLDPGADEALEDGDELTATQGSINLIDLFSQAVFGGVGGGGGGEDAGSSLD